MAPDAASTMVVDVDSIDEVDAVLAAVDPGTTLGVIVGLDDHADVDRLDQLGWRHLQVVSRQVVGLAVVTADRAVQRAIIGRSRSFACPLTALADRDAAAGWIEGQRAVGSRVRAAAPRSIMITPWVQDYLDAHLNPPPDPVFARLRATTRERFGRGAAMNVGEDQGRFLGSIVRLARARRVVEVGTFTGASALWMARNLPPGGRLTCHEVDPSVIEVAREAWVEAGVDDRIDVVLGPAVSTLEASPFDPPVDVAFVDADKPSYGRYVDLLLSRLAPDGVILVDNTLWGGDVVDDDVIDASTSAIREFNDAVSARDDLDVVMLPIGDGVTMITHRRVA